jgi:hypothetical protein
MSQYSVSTGKITLTASATKTAILLNPVLNKVKIYGIDISLDGSGGATSVLFDLYKVTTIGSAAGTTGVLNSLDATDLTAATTTAKTALTVEPTTVVVYKSWYVTPFGGLFPLQMPLGREIVMAGGGANWGIRWTTAASVTPDLVINVDFEE